jgi:hypothetical protein
MSSAVKRKTRHRKAKTLHEQELEETIFKRENPKREVIHFESPPRRRLRVKEDEVLESYQECKIPL